MELLLLIIILLYMLYNENKGKNECRHENFKLKERIKELEKRLKQYEGQENATNNVNTSKIDINGEAVKTEDKKLETIINNEKNKTTGKTDVEEPKVINSVKPQKTKEQIKQEELERKNTIILATGAILIVLAAIVFLVSTWSLLSNVVKAISLFLFIVVFLGASKLSKDKYNLENTSKTFFYIAMAYIPIFLLSISFFSLFGKFLSIYGEGKYIYLAMAFLITSATYNYFYKKHSNIILFYGSIISQITSLVMFALIFSNKLEFIILILLVYNIGLIIFNKIKESEFINGVTVLIEIISIAFGVTFFFDLSYYLLAIYVLIAVNALIMSFNSKDKQTLIIFNSIFNVFVYVIGYYLIFIVFESFDRYLQFIFMIVYIISTYIIIKSLFETNGSEKINYIEEINLIAIGILYLISFFVKSNIVKPYMIAIIGQIFLIIEYLRCKNDMKEIYGAIIPITLVLIFVGFLRSIHAIPELYFVMSIAFFVIGELVRNNKKNSLSLIFLIVSNLLLPLTFMYNLALAENGLKYLILYKFVFVIVYGYYFIRTKNYAFKYLTYAALGFVLAIDHEIQTIGHLGFLAPLFLSLIVILLEEYINKLKDDFSEVFIIFLEMLSYLLLLFVKADVRAIIAFLYTIIIYIYALMNKKITIIPVMGLGIILITANMESNLLNILKLVYIVVLSVLTINKPKLSIETAFSGIMLMSFLYSYEIDSVIVYSIIVMIWALYNYVFSKNGQEADVFKFIAYASGLSLYCSFIYEVNPFGEYKSVYFIGITVFAAMVLNTIINKYMSKDNIDLLEYITFFIIYLVAITNYYDELDGMIFVVFLALVTGVSYYGRDGKIFITSIGAIIINMFLLTREFWFIIPWWMYIMGLGIGLLSFAITNEKRANNRKINNKNIIKRIKDKVEDNEKS